MNIKKQLRKQVEESERKIIENDKEFFEEFSAKYCDEPKNKKNNNNKKKKGFIISLSALSACIVFAVLLILFLPNVGVFGKKPIKNYQEENKVIIESNVEEINSNQNQIKFNSVSAYKYTIERIYDAKYNETLFFNIEISDVLSQINIELYVNKNYPDIKKIESQITEKVNGIEYIIQKDETPNNYIYQAQFTYNGISAYIEYNGLKGISGDNEFISFLERTFAAL